MRKERVEVKDVASAATRVLPEYSRPEDERPTMVEDVGRAMCLILEQNSGREEGVEKADSVDADTEIMEHRQRWLRI